MQLIINGKPLEFTSTDLHRLLQSQGLEPERKGIAIAVNGEVIPRSEWPLFELHDGDTVEVISAMQGG
jgi:sulfur carrier protein